MDEHKSNEIALFRYSVIGSLINGEVLHGGLKKKMKELSRLTWHIPHTRRRYIGRGTIEEWYYLYKRFGFDSLKPSARNDKGKTRNIDFDVIKKVQEAKKANPRRPLFLILRDLYQAGEIATPHLPLSTLYRRLNVSKLTKSQIKNQQKRYQYCHANEMWQTDVMHGPSLPYKQGEKPGKTYLFSIMDDASRLIVAAGFYPSEKLIHLKTVLREAIRTYGIPRRLYVDNAKIYHAHELEIACAKLTIHLIHGQPYWPQGRGKLERYHRTLRGQFLTGLKDVRTLLELNSVFHTWLADEYNRRPHSGIDNETPLEKYLRTASLIKRMPANLSLEELFYHQEKRQVAKDATFRINNILYEAPEHLIGYKIDVLYDSDDMQRVIIQYQGKSEGICKPIDFLSNAKIKRKPINFNRIINPNKEGDDDTCCVLA